MSRGGRPRHPATELVQELLAEGHSLRGIPALVRTRSGGAWTIDRSTVRAIARGRRRPGSSLLRGEERRIDPLWCPTCRAMIEVVPCRTCGWPGP
jgi:hypothetical protein